MRNSLIQSWRWYGSNDPVSLQDIRQAGATAVVSALHHVPHGDIWELDDILERKKIIEAAGLKWLVVESVPVHEAIKTNSAEAPKFLENYKISLKNLAKAGLKIICYNFMPVLDWTRTDLNFALPNGAKALCLDWADLAYFDIYMLKREGAEADYSNQVISILNKRLDTYTPEKVAALNEIICMGVPTEGSVNLEQLHESLAIYENIGKDGLRKNLALFLEAIADVCESYDLKMTIHPDDPPFPILGLPRIASNHEDLKWILNAVDRPFNGICFCTGSLGAGAFNDIPKILHDLGDRVYFAHLRNVKKDHFGNFHESDHLDGDVDMFAVMKELIKFNENRIEPIPFRPDHGHQMLDDLHKVTNPGYSAIGRLKGLAELRGLEMGIKRMMLDG
ncbi:mannonate dehydratase [Belliella baltica DSM 15883]|uniref:Mannonate dehydratase n=1 Tax=Belliella baltica (strain DSM 15883 / CIP 108006 / LMG 21964 / BA134) TaxID=866536 RepID=I3Z686_BELBD|nr:mannonate dehydratase [Belliella baltica]AFL84754.1 mannonate dehydratase [Belliella baltica DSM 15883]